MEDNIFQNNETKTKDDNIKKYILTVIIRAILFIVVIYIIFNFVIGIKRISNVDMYPAIKDGDLIVYNRLTKDFHMEDIVVFEKEKELYYLRIIAKEGDTIDISDLGNVMIDGNIHEEAVYFPTLKEDDIDYPIKLKKDEFFVLGDFRIGSKDSRVFGPIKKEQIKGKVISLFRNRGI